LADLPHREANGSADYNDTDNIGRRINVITSNTLYLHGRRSRSHGGQCDLSPPLTLWKKIFLAWFCCRYRTLQSTCGLL